MNEEKAYEILNKYNVSFKKFEHKPLFTLEGNLNLIEGQQVKNLVLKNKKERKIYFIIIEESKHLDINDLSEKLEEKKLSFLSEEKLTEYIGCQVSAVTPLGLVYDVDHRIEVIIDDELNIEETIGVHPFVNNKTLNIHFKDLLKIFDDLEVKYKYIPI